MHSQYALSWLSPVFSEIHFTAGELRTGFDSSPPFSLPFTSPVAGAGSRPGACAEGVAAGLEPSCALIQEGEEIAVKSSRVNSRVKIDLGSRKSTPFRPPLRPAAIP